MDWDARFKAEDTPWERNAVHPAAKHWFQEKQTGHIIIPGCGRSKEPLFFAQAGFQVTGIDLSETALAWQRSILRDAGLEASFITANLFEWQPPDQADAVYEQTCLCAILPEERPAYATQLLNWLQPGGMLFANFMQRPNDANNPTDAIRPPFDCNMQEMHALFPEAQWQWQDDAPIMTQRTGDNHEIGMRLIKQ